MLEHLLVIVVERYAIWLEVLLAPLKLLLIRREGGNKLSAGSLVQDIQRMSRAHSTKPCNCDLESMRSHCGCEVSTVGRGVEGWVGQMLRKDV
jgi:hypothetical protein